MLTEGGLTDGELTGLPAATEVAAYRIVHEALMNVVRHAHAANCEVRLCRDGELTLEVTDDGIGLAAGHPTGIGLVAIRERAAELGGTAVVERNLPRGTRVLVRLPLPARQEPEELEPGSTEPEEQKPEAQERDDTQVARADR